jgi:hypothetical protein
MKKLFTSESEDKLETEINLNPYKVIYSISKTFQEENEHRNVIDLDEGSYQIKVKNTSEDEGKEIDIKIMLNDILVKEKLVNNKENLTKTFVVQKSSSLIIFSNGHKGAVLNILISKIQKIKLEN